MIKHTRLNEAIDDYEAWMHRSQAFSPNTITTYMRTIRQFAQFTGDVKVMNITPDMVERFRDTKPHWSPSNANRERLCLSQFFAYARRRRWMPKDDDPCELWRRSKTPEIQRFRIPPEDWEPLLDRIPWPPHKMVIALGLYSMLRASEIAHLKVGDINLDTGEMNIYRPKTSRYDNMQAFQELHILLREYLQWYAERMMRDHGKPLSPEHPLIAKAQQGSNQFQHSDGDTPIQDTTTNFKPAYISKRVRWILSDSGIDLPANESAHCLRRSGARAMFDTLVEQGFDGALVMTRDWLDHKDVSTTQIYIGVDLNKKKRNEMAKGQRLLPKADTSNVINLKEARNE